MAIPYWCIRNPWNTCVASDEFGPGTLDGNPVDGASYDACAAAAIENAAAGYENRLPNYSNIGHIRADMISHGQWTAGSAVSNPRTNGAVIGNVAWEIPRRGYQVVSFHDYQDAVLSEADVRAALAYERASIYIITNAQALTGNEQGVHGHFVVIAGYGGDMSDGSTNKVYVLNSDIAGQHGNASGQWVTLAEFLSAQPHGFVVLAPPPPPPPPEPAEDEDLAGATADLTQIRQIVEQLVADALAKLKEPAGS